MNITARQISILHHTLGLRVDRCEPFRNHFVAGPKHHDQPDLDALEAAGLMQHRAAPAFCDSEDVVFSCTDAGKAFAIENLPPEPKCTKYGEYLRSEYGDSFADYLGINKPEYEVRGSWGRFEYRMFRRSRYDACGAYGGVSGDWAKTKKDAKASYKQALKAYRANR